MKKFGLIRIVGAITLAFATAFGLGAQTAGKEAAKPEDTEVWQPEPKVVTPGADCGTAPSDAIILFDGNGPERVGVCARPGCPGEMDRGQRRGHRE